MNYLPPIPSNVPYCHKNYMLAKQLGYKQKGVSDDRLRKPYNINGITWKSVLESFDDFRKKAKVTKDVWKNSEKFFEYLIEQNENNSQQSSLTDSNAFSGIKTGKNSDSDLKKSVIDDLNLQDEFNQDDSRSLVETVLDYLGNYKESDLKMFKNIIEAALTSALTRRQGESQEIEEITSYDIKTANVTDLPNVNQKYLHSKQLKTLMMHRLINGELTALKPDYKAPKELHILVDDSGSMDSEFKRGLLYLTMFYAKKRADKDVIVKVYLFESDLYENDYLLSEGIPDFPLNGGGTDIQKALTSLAERIESPNASVLIINDGQDHVNEDFKPVTRTVAMTLRSNNRMLKMACEKSKGSYYNIS
jgi:hypothetical protein